METMETQNTGAAPQPSLWKSIREAVRGSHQDFTTGSLNRAILLLAIPVVLEMVLESLFAVVDVFFVGRLGADAVATVGLTESLLSLVFAIGLGLSLSTTAMVARRIGERDPAGAAVAGVQAIVLGLAVSVIIGLPCLFYAPDLLRLMGASPQIIAVEHARTTLVFLRRFPRVPPPSIFPSPIPPPRCTAPAPTVTFFGPPPLPAHTTPTPIIIFFPLPIWCLNNRKSKRPNPSHSK